jgi:hypothetical protein
MNNYPSQIKTVNPSYFNVFSATSPLTWTKDTAKLTLLKPDVKTWRKTPRETDPGTQAQSQEST